MYITSTKNVEREKVRELDKRKKRSLKCCLLNFKLDPHKPEWSKLISLKCRVIMIVYALNKLASHANA